ncbi:cobalt-precorrin-6A reductase [Octadecabacter sp.]|nr:cobalt-precorrin-6A reductase [Octadecabacter sp.]
MTLLLLAGTGEARRIACGLADSGVRVTASLAGATRHPEPLPVTTRIGGFGGEDGFRAYIASNGITAVLDATHPFAAKISARTARVCGGLGLPYAQVMRPEWVAQSGDIWTHVDAPADVARHVPQGATVFLATGRNTLAEYGAFVGRRVLVRVIDPPAAPLPFERGEFVIGRPPFSPAYESKLFEGLGVTHLVVKNAGGEGGRAKLDAARELLLPVIMLRRPACGQGVHLDSVQGALAWALRQ